MLQPSPALRLLLAPAGTYRELTAERRSAFSSSIDIVLRAALYVAIAATVAGIAATGRLSWSIFLSGAACWSFVAALQLLFAAAVIVPARPRARLAEAFGLFFLGHAAWSLWLLAGLVFLLAAPEGIRRQDVVFLSAVVPFAWTAVIVHAFCREVLGLGRRPALLAMLLHQSLTAAAVVGYVWWAVALWPRILSLRL